MSVQAGYPPAPVDPAGVADAMAPFGQSLMLPTAAYVDPAVFAWEQQHFFGGWVCAGFSSQLAEPGDQRAERAGTGSVLLTRDSDGALHAFANTCRHRGHELLGCGAQARRGAIVCPYHSWSYTLSGGLKGAPGLKGTPGFDPADWSLAELPVTEWHGLIFVDTSGTAAPMAGLLADLEPVVGPYEPQRLVIAAEHDYDAAANWKIVVENYHECYHCPAIHPELCKVSPPKSGRSHPAHAAWSGGVLDLREGAQTMSLDGASQGVALRGLDGDALRTVTYISVFPNVLLSLHPDYVMTHRLTPVSASRTLIECRWAFAPEAVVPGFDPDYAVKFWDITNLQDWAACESVQRGLSSPHARPGPLGPEESGVYQFVAMVARGYAGQPVWGR